MAGADSPLSGSPRPLAITAFAPLPYRRAGRPAAQSGVTVFYAELLPRLAALGHRVHVYAEAPPAAPGEVRDGLPWEMRGLTVDWFAFEYWPGRRPLDAEYDARVAAPVARLLRMHAAVERPDVVLIGRESLAPAAVDACAAVGVPALLIAHGVTSAALQRGDFPPAVAARLLGALRRVDHVAAVAEHLRTALAALGVSACSVVGNAADPLRFRPAPADPALRGALGIAGDAPVVGHVSRLTDHKRAADLIAAAARVLRDLPAAVFLVVGTGEGRAALAHQAHALGIDAQVRFAGEVDHQRMPDYLNLCDVVVMPSAHETLSLVYRETQACGRVLLASDIAAAREAVVDGVTGVLFRTGDVADLGARLRALLGDTERRRRIGEAARADALARWADDWVGAWEAVLQRAAAPPGPSGGG